MTPATRLAIGGLSAALAIAIAVIAVLAVSGGDDNGGQSAVAPRATSPATATGTKPPRTIPGMRAARWPWVISTV